MFFFINLITLFVFSQNIASISSSAGDRSVIYQKCLNKCVKANCSDGSGITFKNKQLADEQEFWCKLLQWSCKEECCYNCMWNAVNSLSEAGYEIPKFHGKWPFIRVMGMQEPAAAFSSVLNFAANYYMYKKISKEFPLSVPHLMPIVIFWHGFAMVCMNAWVWSTIFHMRDTPFTEFMDYTCALSMVMGLFVASIVRVLYKRPNLTILVLIVPFFHFVTHVRHLYSGAINYDYNMKINITIGALGTVMWLIFAFHKYSKGHNYAWGMVRFTGLSILVLSLELFDFPPKYHAWDAHALWHLSTSPLPLLFYKFVLEDLRHLQRMELEDFTYKLA